MSFDLYFYKQKGSQQTEAELAAYLTKNLPHNISDHPRQWHYENPATGVYFLIDWNKPENDPEQIEIFENFRDFKYLNFNFSINFFRPRFFGFEIFPVIEKFITDLDLYVLNPQDENDPDSPGKFPKGYLEEQWIRQNDSVTVERFRELDFQYLSPDKSNYLWGYQTHRETLQENLTEEDIFVPGYFVVRNKEDGALYTACVWPMHIPVILPPVDYLIIQKEYERLSETVKESGLVSYDTIIKEFGDRFEPFEYEVPNLKVIRQANADSIEKQFNALKLGKTIKEFGNGIAFDGFVNVQP
ncbi:hypothetical protein SAMN04487894_111118 [Niabella drilacis]|uniref:Uncharacterized protein n=1 Tax=Niabella drilacis (strain DSM 25811 / CCM 8410 / CCUG 62505 / LMG 26954 / E90) TaxID=1285928 RepID=A0A1G6WHT4_NIADE|nr:hypothetical protein SAMN04487894_111118 [Niabella drilacis]